MASERGEYRPIYAVILDGKDFQQLPAAARWCLVSLKLKLGPLGIRVLPMAEGHLSLWTGLPAAACAESLQVLQETGWIEIDGSVVWLVRGFEFEPGLSAGNKLHRKMADRLLDQLPRLPIIERFRERVSEWGNRVSDRLSRGSNPQPSGHIPAVSGPENRHPEDSLSNNRDYYRDRDRDTNRDRNDYRDADEEGAGAPAATAAHQKFSTIREQLPERSRAALDGLRKASKGETGLLALCGELEMIAAGGRNIDPKPTWEGIGLALEDLVLNGTPATARALRTYTADAMRQITEGTKSPGPRRRNGKGEDDQPRNSMRRHMEREGKGGK